MKNQMGQFRQNRSIRSSPQKCVWLLSFLLVAVLILGGCLPLQSSSSSPSTSGNIVDLPTAAPTLSQALTPTPSPTPSAAPTSPPPTPALPVNPMVEVFFGPLPIAAGFKPLVHHQIRALYTGAAKNLDANLAIARTTEVNALVIDLKEHDGILFDCTVPLALEIGAVRPAYDLTAVVSRCHAEGIKVIGRVVCFKDDLLAASRPDLCISDKAGRPLRFSSEGGKSFASPYNQINWQYNIDVALEAVAAGIDEIQFDYVRFPTGPSSGGAKPWFGQADLIPDRVSAINRFLQTAKIRIQDEKGIPLGADVFAITLTSAADGRNLGQDWPTIGLTGIDSISPMIYPSHYANSSTGHYSGNGQGTVLNGILYPRPDLQPYDIVYNVLLLGKEKAPKNGFAANRPWLQAFTADYLPEGYYRKYGAEEIQAQIKAVEDAGFQEWIFWSFSLDYDPSAFAAQD